VFNTKGGRDFTDVADGTKEFLIYLLLEKLLQKSNEIFLL
jgi:hypothetical protein